MMRKNSSARKTIYATAAIIFIACLLLSVSAHSGRTDSEGGHVDKSTGEYHYHHGYPAHDHYDMDGDGDIDCPYDFDDQTNKNTGYDSNGSSEQSNGHSKGNDSSDTITHIVIAVVFSPIIYLLIALPLSALISDKLFQWFSNLLFHNDCYNETACEVFSYILAVCLTIPIIYILIISR